MNLQDRSVCGILKGMGKLPFTLYRLYDYNDNLLYIGKTINLVARFNNHKRRKSWWKGVRTIGLTHYDSISELANAEKAAIRSEKPLHNIQYNGKQIPRAFGIYPRKLEAACEWLLETLEPGELYSANDIISWAIEEQVASKRTLEHAKADLDIPSRKISNKWYWYIDLE